jgi:hypothetical protein
MSRRILNRRTLLRGMLTTGAAATIPLPLLDAMLNGNGNALAQSGTALSPLYVTWFFGNGSLPGLWKPAAIGSGDAWTLSSQLQPLAAVKSYLTVVSGLVGKLVVSGIEHPSGSAAATTGAPLSGNAVRSASIDQVIADLISEGAPYRSLEVGVTPATPNGNQHSLHSVSHRGPDARNNPEFDPREVFNRLFTSGAALPVDNGEDDDATRAARAKASILDAIKADGTALQQRLGATDKQRVEKHLDAIRAIELRLDTTGGGAEQPPACTSITPTDVGPDTKNEAPPGVNTAMVELTTLALSCELTRVVSYMFSLPAAHVYYRHLGNDMNDDFHDTICHGDAGDSRSQTRVDTGVLYAMRCLNEFLTSLQSTPHGDGNLLDSSLVYVTSDTAWGKVHDPAEWPVLFAGKAGGKLAGDEHHNFAGENLSRALLTAARIMGSTQTEFGIDGGHVTAELPGIIV